MLLEEKAKGMSWKDYEKLAYTEDWPITSLNFAEVNRKVFGKVKCIKK